MTAKIPNWPAAPSRTILRVLEQRPEVRHRADADEDEQREQLVLDARLVQDGEQPVRADDRGERQVRQHAAGGDGQEQQRLVVLDDREVQEQARDREHDHGLPGERRDPASSWSIVSWLIPGPRRAAPAGRPGPTGWPGLDLDRHDHGGARRADRVAHLHRLEDEHRVAALEDRAGGDVDLEDDAGHRCGQRRRRARPRSRRPACRRGPRRERPGRPGRGAGRGGARRGDGRRRARPVGDRHHRGDHRPGQVLVGFQGRLERPVADRDLEAVRGRLLTSMVNGVPSTATV